MIQPHLLSKAILHFYSPCYLLRPSLLLAVHTPKPSLHTPFVSKAYASSGQPHLICHTHLLFLPAKHLSSGLFLKSSLPHSHSMRFHLNCQLLGIPIQGQHRPSQGTLSIIHQSVTQTRLSQNSSEG